MANMVRRNEGNIMPRVGGGNDPFDVMREMLSLDPLRALFGGAMGLQQMPMHNFVPHFEVRETDDAYIFRGDLPGVRDEDLEITLAQSRLTISGRREMEQRNEQDRYYAVERAYGSFTRTFTLPTDVDPNRVEAELRDGVLNLRIAKSPEQQPKKVQVRTTSGGGGSKTAKATNA